MRETPVWARKVREMSSVEKAKKKQRNQECCKVSEEIKQQMNEQMKADPNQIYWSEAADQPTDVQPFKQIKPNQTFYINTKHQLIITFAQGEIAPYYMGTPEFVIPTKIIKQQLASPNYLSN